MKGDFSRSSFDAKKHYCGVRLQQGRVQLDADWNEQVDIQLQQRECERRDLVGVNAAPDTATGFAITLAGTDAAPLASAELIPPDVTIESGRRYVDGMLCINETDLQFSAQPDFPGAEEHRLATKGEHLLVYLEVWQHHISAREDPTLREVALDGLDTTTRIKTIAQVKFWTIPDAAQPGETQTIDKVFDRFRAVVQQKKGELTAHKSARGTIPQNQLYRVEIHQVENDQVYCKWSRENGAVAYAVKEIIANGASVDLDLSDVKAQQLDLRIDDWVEITSNDDALNGYAGVLGKVLYLQPDIQRVTVEPLSPLSSRDPETCRTIRCVLQRWDQKGSNSQPLDQGRVPVSFEQALTLEHGIEVQFSRGAYAVGDYWLIPARANLRQGRGDILPPADQRQPPAGIIRHFAPLAILQHNAGVWQVVEHDRSTFRTLPVLSDDVDQLATRMTSAELEIDQLRYDVGVLKQLGSELKQRVSALEKRMDKVEERLAALQRLHLYQDFRCEDELTEGMVVAYHQTIPDHVEKATINNAQLLVGVVVDDERKPIYRVAMQGRTKCKVVGHVAPGSLLIPAHKPGYAAPAGLYLQPGTVLGKVLHVPDLYNRGHGDEVDVLITLS